MKLKEYMDNRGIPIARFAKRCNLTYPQIRHILIGKNPTLETALRIEEYTQGDVSPRDLLNEDVRKEIYGSEQEEEQNQETKES